MHLPEPVCCPSESETPKMEPQQTSCSTWQVLTQQGIQGDLYRAHEDKPPQHQQNQKDWYCRFRYKSKWVAIVKRLVKTKRF
jgi:hypothetical protein